VKYLTTVQVARELGVSKQTLLNWLYAGKVPEPPRNRKGYRLWSSSRLSLVRRLIGDGRLGARTVVHREPANRPELVTEFAREVNQFLRDAAIRPESFLKELARVNPAFAPRRRRRRSPSSDAAAPSARSGGAAGKGGAAGGGEAPPSA